MRPIDADAFKKYIDAQEGRPFIGCTVGEAMKILIDEQPSVQPEPQEGHWINGKCDLCGEHAPFWAMASTYHESNYCPRCGAKMKGAEHETN